MSHSKRCKMANLFPTATGNRDAQTLKGTSNNDDFVVDLTVAAAR